MLTSYNAVVALRQRIDKAWANIDVVLKQRHDQLPNLVAAVRGLMAYERDVLTRVTEIRAAYSPTAPIPDQAATSDATSTAVRSLFAVVERYPEVKAGTNVQDLQDEIERIEGMIAARRELYNDQVYRYNTRISQFPGNLLAPVFGWRRARVLRRHARRCRRPGHGPAVGLTMADPGGPAPTGDVRPDLWLVRHGETEWAQAGAAYRADGHPADRDGPRPGPRARPPPGGPSPSSWS